MKRTTLLEIARALALRPRLMVLEVQDLHVNYGSIRALRGVSLTVDSGQVVVLLGANGAGKSTLLRAVSN